MARGKKTGGRQRGTPNKSTSDLREAAQQFTADALQTLVDVMKDEAQPAAARISAANSLLDRGHGKPQTFAENSISVESGESFPTQIELVAFESSYLKRLQESVLSEGANNG